MANQAPYPTWVKFAGPVLLFALGPLLLVVGALGLVERSGFTERAIADVVRVNKSDFGSGWVYCPIYEWEHRGEKVKSEGPCERLAAKPSVGQTVSIRYPGDDYRSARPDTFNSMYAEFIPVGIVGTAFTCLFVFVVIRLARPKQ